MKKILQVLLLMVASFGVVSLAYYAYILATDTLTIPIPWQRLQYGHELMLTVAPPGVASLWQQIPLLDADAISSSLLYNGAPFVQTHSGESTLMIRHDFLRFVPNGQHMKTGDVFVLSAERYNHAKKTAYRLPHDITLVLDEIPRNVTIESVGSPHEARYRVNMYGYNALSSKDIRWYMRDPSVTGSCFDPTDRVLWNARTYTPISSELLSTHMRGQIEEAEYRLNFDSTLPRQCIIAGIANRMILITDRTLTSFTVTGVVTDMLSPEYRMQSRIEYQFSAPIFSDSGSVYSAEYIAHRSAMKRRILEKIRISPSVSLAEENIVLTPNRLSLMTEFQEWVRYTVEWADIEDIYGRHTSNVLSFTPKKLPYLSVVFEWGKNMFSSQEAINANIYSLTPPKSLYTMKVCRMDLEGYSQMERIVSEQNPEYYDAVYHLLESSHATGCVKKDIPLLDTTAVTPFAITDMFEDNTISPGLYVLAFRDRTDLDHFDRFVSPRVFSVIDSHVTMKVDASGDMEFLVTDIHTGLPKSGQSIEVLQNIGVTSQETWNPSTQSYETQYLPLSQHTFSSGVEIGFTNTHGILRVDQSALESINYGYPYSLMNEYSSPGRYPSFVAISRGKNALGYVVSTWNDGITGWNFGLKESDYGWYVRPRYSAYIHTDRRLYMPGETVYVHAILRENSHTLRIPEPENFKIEISDSAGNTVKEALVKSNDFGTLVTEYVLPQDSNPGMYSVMVRPFRQDATDDGGYIDSGWTSFQVEHFKKPTFTAQIELRSPQIQNDIVQWIRKKANTDPFHPWYEHQYSAPIVLEGMIRANYYHGASMKQMPFHYRVFRSPHYSDEFWSDCFWWCHYTPSPTFYTEWNGMIDQEGIGYIRIPLEFVSFSDDFLYTVEVTIRDPLTGEEVTTPSTILAKLPSIHKEFSLHTPLVASLDRRIVQPGESLKATMWLTSMSWEKALSGQYEYTVSRRVYTERIVDDLRMHTVAIPSHEYEHIVSGSVENPIVSIDTTKFVPGEYILRTTPRTAEGVAPPQELVSETSFYITGTGGMLAGEVQVIPEKTIYQPGETARILFVSPFQNGFLYITHEREGIRHSEYIRLEGNSLMKEYVIDSTFEPNAYIGAIAFPAESLYDQKPYSVGYSEIIVDISSKRVHLDIVPDKEVYRNRDTVTLDLSLRTKSGAMLSGELAVMVVDESLIRLLGNVDLDIIPKFYKKFSFTTRTALTAIGMVQNRFLSRRGISGGSGDKWGKGAEIASRSLFKNTVYFNGSILTDASGRARVEFSLPDNVTDYRVIALGQTKDSRFATSEQTLSVRREYTLQTHIPAFAYPEDTFDVTLHAFNATRTITATELRLEIGTGASVETPIRKTILPVSGNHAESYRIRIDKNAPESIPYRAILMRSDEVLDQIDGVIRVNPLPLITTTERQLTSFTGETHVHLVPPAYTYASGSTVSVRVANSFFFAIPDIVHHLLEYPYGCAEQTLSALTPGIILSPESKKFLSAEAQKQLETKTSQGMQQLLRMQYMGGWKYWESDVAPNERVTPHIVRTLWRFFTQGYPIDPEILNEGMTYLANIVEFNNPEIMKDIDYQAEIFAALSSGWHPLAWKLLERIRPDLLSRHGLLVYIEGLQAGWHPIDGSLWEKLENHFASRNGGSYDYWNYTSDQAIYAQILIRRGEYTKAGQLIDHILRSRQGDRRFFSTQESIQLLQAIELYHAFVKPQVSPIQISLTSGIIQADVTLGEKQSVHAWVFERDKLAEEITLRTNAREPVFVEIIEQNIPQDITEIPHQNRFGLQVERLIERIDESKWVDAHGTFRSAEIVKDHHFAYGALYRVTVRVWIDREHMLPRWQYLTVENFLAGGIYPMTGKYQTESRLLESRESHSYWDYLETRQDRIMAQQMIGYNSQERIFQYYFRPEFRGTYLLPPTHAYFMYQPEIYSLAPYTRITID